MKNKKLNILFILCILLFLSINTFSIGVNDTTTYVTKAEFETRLTSVENRLIDIESNINNLISDYISTIPMMFEAGNKISITKNMLNNLYTISYSVGEFSVSLSTSNTTIWTTRSFSGNIKGTTMNIPSGEENPSLRLAQTNPTLSLACLPSPDWDSQNVSTSGLRVWDRNNVEYTPSVSLTAPNLLNITIPSGATVDGMMFVIQFNNFYVSF